MPRYPHRRHPIHILAPIRVGDIRGLAGALADPAHPDLPFPQRRRSAEIASKLCGQVAKIKPSWTVTESAQQAQVSLLSGRAGGSRGSVGTSKSFREQREALFQPREFGLLPNCQAICLPYDGTHATSAVRVYLKPYYLPVDTPYWRAVETGKI